MIPNLLVVIAPVVLILGIITRTILILYPRANIPSHLTQHPVIIYDNLIPKDAAAEIMTLIKQMKSFPSNIAADLKAGGARLHEDIGEGVPLNKFSKCDHPLLVPNPSKTKCSLPQRIDVGRHFILTGGLDGNKEKFDDMISRVTSFGKYHFPDELSKFPVIQNLFASDTFQTAAKTVCPAQSQILDPFQFNVIMQVPGQSVAAHIDAPYFWGASRFEFPQWLLAAMVFSNLFSSKFIDQVQVVGYLHSWAPNATGSDGGEFVYFNNETSIGSVTPNPLSGSIVDGSKVIHAAKIYKPSVKAPRLPKDKLSSLDFVGGDQWELTVNGKPLQKYHTSDLRISIVYRARCFATQEEVHRYYHQTEAEKMTLEQILETFQKDLIQKGKLTAGSEITRLDLAFLIMDTYITYPLPAVETALIPYNYCAVSKAVPQLSPLLDLFC